jgi:hypothetical protein
MKHYIFYISLILCVLSCKDAIEKPKNLLPEDQMTKLIAEFSINEQSSAVNPQINGENATRFILKKYKVNGEAFTASYQYYMTKPDKMRDILNEAQKIIKKKDPKAEDYIDKKLKQNQNPQQVK